MSPSSSSRARSWAAPRPAGLLAAVLSLVLVACTGAAASSAPPSTTPSPSATPTTAPSSQAPTPSPTPSYPLSLTDDEGTGVVLKSEPRKIVALTPAATEILFALGAGDRVVGKVQDIADYPPAAHNVPEVAVIGQVDAEKIVGLGADLVIAGGNFGTPADAITKLRSLGLPVLVVYAPDVAGAYKDIELIGQAIGLTGPAKDLTAAMRAGVDQITAATASLPKPKVFYETGTDPTGTVYGIADDSVYAALIGLAGGTPVTTGSTSDWSMSTERLVSQDPAVILLGDGAYGMTAADVAKRAGWGVVAAVKDGAIRTVDDIVVTRPGPRLVEGLRALALAIHPDAAIPSLAPLPVPSS